MSLQQAPLPADPSGGADESGDSSESSGYSRYLLFNLMPSWLVSFLLHVVLILVLALVVLTRPTQPPIAFEVSDVQGEQLESLDVDLSSLDMSSSAVEVEPLNEPEPVMPELPMPELEPTTVMPDLTSELTSSINPADISKSASGGEMAGRSGDMQAAMAKKYGATTESEQSVDLALEWLAKHQSPDGSWCFDHTIGPGDRSRKDPGSSRYANSLAASTGMALLPFLGKGHTQHVGQYRENVARGLAFLQRIGEQTPNGLSFWEYEGSMYGHGLATIAICEAYAMTDDQSLRPVAEQAIRFIEYAQNTQNGGWRYDIREPGDTSVVGWQVMALKSAKMGKIEIEERTWKMVKKFLDSVSRDYGAFYGYMEPPGGNLGLHKSRTAIGLLCRMYMGWEKERSGLVEGVTWLSEYGPSLGTRTNPTGANMYYNYYATQVLKHYGGEMWTRWNNEMRDFLVQAQDTEGAERGSWYFTRSDDLGPEAGGRLYCTCMAAMTLEVYYRFLPLYEDDVMDEPFPLDD